MSDASPNLVRYSEVVNSLISQNPGLSEDQIDEIRKEQMIKLKKESSLAGFRAQVHNPDDVAKYIEKYVTQDERDRLSRAVAETRKPPQPGY